MYKIINKIKGRNKIFIINKSKIIVSDNIDAINLLHYVSNVKKIILLSPCRMKKYNDEDLYNYIKKKF